MLYQFHDYSSNCKEIKNQAKKQANITDYLSRLYLNKTVIYEYLKQEKQHTQSHIKEIKSRKSIISHISTQTQIHTLTQFC